LFAQPHQEVIMHARALLVLVLPCALVVPVVSGEKGAEDLEKLQGTWTLVSGENEGKPVPPDKIQGSLVVIRKGTMIANDKDNKKLYVMEFKLDPAQRPKAIDMTITEGPDKGKAAKGIYALQGDRLELAYAIAGERPKSFSTKPKDAHLSFVLRRVKP
jgi:uncharacterized protein (TIGR03067 family)